MKPITYSLLLMAGIAFHSTAYAGEPVVKTYNVMAEPVRLPADYFPAKTVSIKWSGSDMEQAQTVTIPNIFENYRFQDQEYANAFNPALEFIGQYNPVGRKVTFTAPFDILTSLVSNDKGTGHTYLKVAPMVYDEYYHFQNQLQELSFTIDDDGNWAFCGVDSQSGGSEGRSVFIGALYSKDFIPILAQRSNPYTLKKYRCPYLIKSLVLTPVEE